MVIAKSTSAIVGPDGLSTSVCGEFHRAIELIGRRWTGAIISAMLGGADRACDIRVAIPGLSDRLLTERLRELDEAGIVSRTVTESRPPAVRYSLTDKGRELGPIVDAIRVWGSAWDTDGTEKH